jgi:hypothetical protein
MECSRVSEWRPDIPAVVVKFEHSEVKVKLS